jgi:PAS domain S-box-containing protein
LAFVAATAGTLAFWDAMFRRVPFALYFAAVTFCAWRAGWLAGIGMGLAGVLTISVRQHFAADLLGPSLILLGVSVIISLLAATRDRALGALRESEQRLRLGLRAGNTGTWDWDIRANKVVWSDQLYAFHGLRPDEFDGTVQGFAKLVHPEDSARVSDAMRSATEHGQPFELEFRTVRPGGEVRWLSTTGQVLFEDAEPVRMLGATIDVTDRKRAGDELRRSEARFGAVVRSALDCIVGMDDEGRVTEWNPAAEQTFGYSRDEAIGRELASLVIPPALRTRHREGLSRYLATGEGPVLGRRIEITAVRKDGSELPVELTIIRLPGEGPPAFTGYIRDITERKRAEEARRMSEFRWQRLVEQSPLSTQIFSPDGTIRQVNRAWERLWGVTPADLPGYNILHDEQLVQCGMMPLFRRAFAGEAVTIEPIPYTLDRGQHAGRARWCGAYVYPVKDDAGRVEEVVLVHNDVTEQRQAEEEVRRSQRQLASIIDNTPSAVFIKDVRGRYLLVNAPYERMAGVPVGSMTGKMDTDVFPPEVAAHFRGEDERVAAYREPMTFEEAFEFKGEHRTFVTNKFPLRDETGTVYAVCGIATDVTALKRAEASVRESEQRLRLGLRAGRTGTWDWDIARNHVVWSEQVYEIHGLRPEEFGGTSEDFANLVHPDDAERVWSLVQAALHEGKPYEVEFRAVRPSGEVRWLFTTGQVTRDDGGSPVRMMGALIDTTDRKRAEAERERLLEAERAARAEAERASRMKDEFLATLSHELRTPLNAILGWSQILASGGRDEQDMAEGLRTIERNARAQTQIIEDLLDLSRVTSGKVRLDVQRVDLRDLMRMSLETAKPSAEAKGIRLQAVLDPHAGPVSGDPNRLQQVFWNLLNNAVKFTPKGGRVQVVLERVNSHVEVSITDTGEGIAPEFLPHVFDRFRQADATTTRRHGGLGIGLSIVKQLVELHGGSVRVKSLGIGHGATFNVTLPLTVVHPEPEPAVERRHPRTPSSSVVLPDNCAEIAGVRVLVVDDDPDAQALVKRLLEDCRAEVTTAGSAAEAMERMRLERPHVLVSDVGMPGEDGYSLIKQVRDLELGAGARVPAIALTAYARAEDRVKAITAGFDMHLAKPVEPAELVAMVASLAARGTS